MKSKTLYGLLAIVIAVGAISACRNKKNSDKQVTKDILKNEYSMSVAPNRIDKAGYVFAMDKSKKPFPIFKLDLATDSSQNVLKSSTLTQNITWGALADFLGVPGVDLTANTSFKDTTSVTTTVSYKGTSISRAYLLTAMQAFEKQKTAVIEFIKSQHLENYKFFLIIESIHAKQVDYKFDQTVAGEAGLEANFKKIVTVNPNVNWNKTSGFQLSYNLSEPLIVFYKAYPIYLESSLTGGDFSIKMDTLKPSIMKNGIIIK